MFPFANPFASVTDYRSVLERLAWFTWALTVAVLYVIDWRVPKLVECIKLTVYEYEGVPLHLGFALVALLVAFLSRVFKIHDRISDVFGIRERFDVSYILLPMVAAVRSDLGIDKQEQLKIRRQALMQDVFYKYVYPPSGEPVVGQHRISEAMTQWLWFWVVLEMLWILSVLSLLLLYNGDYPATAFLLVISLALVCILPFIQRMCGRYARDEVREILSDSTRQTEIRQAFSAL